MRTSWAGMAGALVLAALVAGGCGGGGKTTVKAPQPDYAGPLAGTWSWVYSVGGIAGQRTTPVEAGRIVSYTFVKDGTLRVDRTPGEERLTRFSLLPGFEPRDTLSVRVIRFIDPLNVFPPAVEIQNLRIRGDTLVLTDRFADGFEHTFVRARTEGVAAAGSTTP